MQRRPTITYDHAYSAQRSRLLDLACEGGDELSGPTWPREPRRVPGFAVRPQTGARKRRADLVEADVIRKVHTSRYTTVQW